jgi:AcrR family transcriptional regulator
MATDRPLRRDAERNRLRILEAAREAFAEEGLGITLDEIARRAGVGVGTVYRRFPDKQQLIEALFEERVDEVAGLAEEALAGDDPWEAFVTFLRRATSLHAADRGLKEVVLGGAVGQRRIARARARMVPLVTELVRRAQEQGALRQDLAVTDVPLIQFMIASMAERTRDVKPEAWRRYLEIVIDGLHAQRDGTTPLGAAPLDPPDLEVALKSG